MSHKPPSLWTLLKWRDSIFDAIATWWWDRHTAEGRQYWRNK